MKYPQKIALTFTVLFLFSSCTTTYYIPNTQNVPAIHAKGATAVNLAGNGNQVEFQAAYGLTDALAVQANGAWFIPHDEDNGNGGSGSLYEGGIGYYKNLSEHWLFDTYALVGAGHLENHFPSTLPTDPATTGRIEASALRYGLQPSITYHTPYFSVSGSVRGTQLSYSNISGSLYLDGLSQQRYLADNSSNFLLEPALTLRGGSERLKLQVQLMQSFNLSNSNFKQDKTLLSVGLSFSLGEK
ncbi:MAG: hypothetical protein ABI373_09880 [Flavobacteriales bacterium]